MLGCIARAEYERPRLHTRRRTVATPFPRKRGRTTRPLFRRSGWQLASATCRQRSDTVRPERLGVDGDARRERGAERDAKDHARLGARVSVLLRGAPADLQERELRVTRRDARERGQTEALCDEAENGRRVVERVIYEMPFGIR